MTQVATNVVPTLSYGSLSVGLLRADFEKSGGDISLFDKVDKLDGNADGKLRSMPEFLARDVFNNSFKMFSLVWIVSAIISV